MFNRETQAKQEISRVFGGKVFQSAFIKTSEIDFSREVVKACESNMCGMYGKTWTCPPAVGNLDTLKKHYLEFEDAFVFTTKHELEDCFDVEGMTDARISHDNLAQALREELKLGECAFEMLKAGGCSICKKCTYPDAPCRFPDKARPSVEAAGINVVKLACDVGINYHNGENTVTYFSVLFFNKNSD